MTVLDSQSLESGWRFNTVIIGQQISAFLREIKKKKTARIFSMQNFISKIHFKKENIPTGVHLYSNCCFRIVSLYCVIIQNGHGDSSIKMFYNTLGWYVRKIHTKVPEWSTSSCGFNPNISNGRYTYVPTFPMLHRTNNNRHLWKICILS